MVSNGDSIVTQEAECLHLRKWSLTELLSEYRLDRCSDWAFATEMARRVEEKVVIERPSGLLDIIDLACSTKVPR